MTINSSLSPRDIYPLLLDGKEIRLSCPDRRTFNSLRVALAKQHQLMVAIGGSEQSLIARFDDTAMTALYKLDQRRAGLRFTILEIADSPLGDPVGACVLASTPGDSSDGSQIRRSLETLSSERESHSPVPEEGS